MNVSLFNQRSISSSLLIIVFLFGTFFSAHAQTFKWATQTPMAEYHVGAAGPFAAADAEGNVYRTMQFYGSQDFDPGPGTDIVSPLKPDMLGVYVSKFDSSGKYLWTKCVLTGSGFAYGVIADHKGDVIVMGGGSGYYQTSKGIDSTTKTQSGELFLTKLDSKGNFVWFRHTQTLGAEYLWDGVSPIGGIRVDTMNNIYIGGIFTGTCDFDEKPGVVTLTAVSGSGNASNGFIAKYDRDGKALWAKGIVGDGSAQTGTAEVYGIGIDPKSQDVYLGGNFMQSMDFDPGPKQVVMTSAGLYDIFLVKLDQSGQYLWANRIGGTSLDMLSSVSVGGLGSVYIGGIFRSPDADFDPGPDSAILTPSGASVFDICFARYDADGKYLWAKALGGDGAHAIPAGAMADDLDNFYLPGIFSVGPLDLDPGPDTAFVRQDTATFSSTDGFLAKYDACGSFKSGFRIGSGVKFDYSGILSVFVRSLSDGSVDAYGAGNFSGKTDFDFGPDTFSLRPQDMTDAYLFKVNYPATDNEVVSVTACGEQFVYNGNTYKESGRYVQVNRLEGGCDSVSILQLSLSYVEKPIINVNEFELGVTSSYTKYQWLKNDTVIEGATESIYNVTENANYRVIVWGDNGCSDTSDIYVVKNYTSINDLMDNKDIAIYPNPSSGLVHIKTALPVDVQITDMRGSVVLKKKAVRTVSLKTLSKGMYLIQVCNSQGQILKVDKLVLIN